MNSTHSLTHSASNRQTAQYGEPEATDSDIILNYYNFSEVHPSFQKIGRGTPQGAPFSLRPRLVPVPRWLPPKPMNSFNAPHRSGSYMRNPSNAKNYRTLCWMHTESRLLAKSPLNDTTHRASMPTRPQIPLRGSMFCRPSRPSQALRAFGTILPGSTPQACKLSVPLRDVNEHIFRGTSKTPKPTPIQLPTPPPGVAADKFLHPCRTGGRVMVHRMNLAKQTWNTATTRTRRLALYTKLASEVAPLIKDHDEPILPALRSTIHNINGICAYAQKMAVIEGSETRHKEAIALAQLRDFFHKLLQTEQTPAVECSEPSSQALNPLLGDPTVANTTGPTDTQELYPSDLPEPTPTVVLPTAAQEPHHDRTPSSTDVFTSTGSSASQQSTSRGWTITSPSHPTLNDSESITGSAHEALSAERQHSPVILDPKPRQKQSRAPAPSTRVLRSMVKEKGDHTPVTTVASNMTASASGSQPRARHQPHKQSKGKKAFPPSTVLVEPVPSIPRYNLRSRKRELDEAMVSGQDSKQANRPAKRRRA